MTTAKAGKKCPHITRKVRSAPSNGDRIYFPIEGGTDVSNYKFPEYGSLTPDYDFTKKAPEGEMPIQDGVTAWWCGAVIRAYNSDRLPESLSHKEWHIIRIQAESGKEIKETVPVDWKYLTRVVFDQESKKGNETDLPERYT